MKNIKKIGFFTLLFVELLSIIGVYIVRGQIGPYIWSTHVFLVGPIATVALLIQLIILVVKLCKRKKEGWNVSYLILTVLMAYPVTVLFGMSVLTYPTSDKKADAIRVTNPVEGSVLLGGKEFKPHAAWPSECYAYDILKEPYDIDSDNLSDYGIYLEDVYCPVNEIVIDW